MLGDVDNEEILNQIFHIEDVLTPTHLKMLVDTAKSRTIDWSFLDNTHTDSKQDYLNAFGFIHDLYDYKTKPDPDKHWGTFVAPLLVMIDKLDFHFQSLLRARINMTVRTGSSHPGYPHIDDNEMFNMWSAIFYVEDSDGPTYFYDFMRDEYSEDQTPRRPLKVIKKVEPVKNSGVIFNANIYHSGMLPKDHQTRILVNYNFTGHKK